MSRTPREDTDRRLAIGLTLAVSLAAVAAFAPALANGFVGHWDDQDNFLRNDHFRGLGPRQLRWAWTTRLLGVYQPLSWMLFEAEYAAFGLSPTGYHAVSLALHAINAALFFALCAALIARANPEFDRRSALISSALAATLWAVHPLRVEAVAWASCQPYLPSTGFALASVLAYLRAEGRHRGRWYVVSLLLFVAAGLSKAVAMPLPAVLLILDLKKRGRSAIARTILAKVPFFLVSLVVAVLAIWAREDSARREVHSLAERLVPPAYGLAFYPFQTIFPVGLTAFHFIPEPFDPFETPFVVSLCGLAVLVGLVAWFGRRHPAVWAAFMAYVVIVSPCLGLSHPTDYLVADRYGYLSTMSLFALLAGGLVRLTSPRFDSVFVGWVELASPTVGGAHGGARKLDPPYERRDGRWRWFCIAAGLILIAVLTGLSWSQCRTWRDAETLRAHAIADRPFL